VAGGVLLALGWAAPAAALHQRNAVWETRRSLWADAVEKAPRNARAWLSLAYAALHENQLAESVRLNERALALAGGNVNLELQILRNLGAGQLLLGQVDAAEATFRRGVNTGYWDADILNNLAVTLMEKKKLDEAEVYARRAIAVEPAKGEAWNTLGELALKKGSIAEALQLFERSISLDPDVEVRHYNRGLALLRLGQREQACAIWSRLRADHDPGLRRNLVLAIRGECGVRR
jgi:tetratricopeptide (TPR) repeat protein